MARATERKGTERIRLTPGKIKSHAAPSGNQAVYVFDEDPRQLCVRITPAGARSFVFASKLGKVPLRITIGSTDVWNLDDARQEARRLQTEIDQGNDPRELKRERLAAIEASKAAAEAAKLAAEAAEQAAIAEAERRKRYSLRALCVAYAALLANAGKARSAAAAMSGFRCHVFTHASIAGAPAKDITPHQVAELVRRVREAGKERAAGVLRAYLSAAFNAAKRAPFDSALPADLIPFGIEHNPVDVIPTIAIKRGDRTLSAAELRAYLGHLLRIGQEAGPELTDMALLLALYAGGQRMAQLLRAKVGDFDPDTATLRLWDGKGKRTQPREHLLPLAPMAAGMVSSLVERAKAREQARAKEAGRAPDMAGLWLFSAHGRVAMNPETVSSRAAEISASMGGDAFDLRDVRRTVETMLAAMRISKDVRAQLLSHGISGVQAAHYDRHTYADEKRAALVAWEARIAAIVRDERPASNVVRLDRAA